MKIRLAVTYISVLFLSLLITWGYAKRLETRKQTNNRLLQNLNNTEQSLEYYKTENGELAAKNTVFVYTIDELEQTQKKLVSEIENLKVKPKRVTTLSQTASKTEINITVPVHDTITSDSVTGHILHFHDDWLSIRAMAIEDTAHIAIRSVDTIMQVVYKGKRKKPYLWFFSPRQLEQVITSKNPYTTIVYNKTIQITK